MTRAIPPALALLVAAFVVPAAHAGAPAPRAADDAAATAVPGAGSAESEALAGDRPALTPDGLEPLVPELARHPYRIAPGVRPYRHRLAFSPGFGSLGSQRLFTFRFAYNPNAWLGYEGSIDHNPGRSVHAALHSLSVIVRRPLPGRLQPYLTAGYGMLMVFPGRTFNADPVTRNALSAGGGLEFFVRGDLAVRADVRYATVVGSPRDRDGLVAYDYVHQTIGLAFYRAIQP